MSGTAKKVWRDYISRLDATGILSITDGPALAELCENRAELYELRKGMRQIIATLNKQAKRAKKPLLVNAWTSFAKTAEGRRLSATMASLDQRIITREREFGLTPSSRTHVGAISGAGEIMDPIERALCVGELSS